MGIGIRKTINTATPQLNSLKDIINVELNILIAEEMEKNVDKHFDQGRGPSGKWAPVKDSTRKANPRPGGRPLVVTGKLRNSAKTKATATQAIVFYSRKDEQGREVAGKLNQERTFLYLDNEGVENIEQLSESIARRFK